MEVLHHYLLCNYNWSISDISQYYFYFSYKTRKNSYLCIKAQKVHLFRPGQGFLVEAEPRHENRRGQKALFGRDAHNVFRVRLGKNFEVIFDRCQVRYTM
jgi:hypothetical protein